MHMPKQRRASSQHQEGSPGSDAFEKAGMGMEGSGGSMGVVEGESPLFQKSALSSSVSSTSSLERQIKIEQNLKKFSQGRTDGASFNDFDDEDEEEIVEEEVVEELYEEEEVTESEHVGVLEEIHDVASATAYWKSMYAGLGLSEGDRAGGSQQFTERSIGLSESEFEEEILEEVGVTELINDKTKNLSFIAESSVTDSITMMELNESDALEIGEKHYSTEKGSTSAGQQQLRLEESIYTYVEDETVVEESYSVAHDVLLESSSVDQKGEVRRNPEESAGVHTKSSDAIDTIKNDVLNDTPEESTSKVSREGEGANDNSSSDSSENGIEQDFWGTTGKPDESEHDEEDSETDYDKDAAEKRDVCDAINYMLRQEKPVEKGLISSIQAEALVTLPLTELNEILKHFELCDCSGAPIDWDLLVLLLGDDSEGSDATDADIAPSTLDV